MRQIKSGNSLLPFFGRLNTIPDFSRVARHFALIRKAIAELRKVEDIFLARDVTDDEYKTGLQDMIDMSGIVAKEANGALSRIASIRKSVQGYEKELVNVLD